MDPENVVVSVTLNPVGKAATLTNQRMDKVPEKTIKFDPKLLYAVPVKTVVPRTGILRSSGENYVQTPFKYFNYKEAPLDDISGTWMNTDANTNGITKLIITGNNSIKNY